MISFYIISDQCDFFVAFLPNLFYVHKIVLGLNEMFCLHISFITMHTLDRLNATIRFNVGIVIRID